MKRGKLKLGIFCLLIGVLLAFPLSSNGQQKSAQPDFPSNDDLRKRNVALLMEGFMFTPGVNRNGEATWDGLGFMGVRWAGSGFIVKEDGTILTNYHVARRALKGQAKFDDGSTFEIRNIKVYSRSDDLAVLKISGQRTFPKVTLGDSDRIEPRDKVLAVGNPMGRGINITEGTVSQAVRDDYTKVKLIEHTATITSGNSGGALYKGDKVIGVNVSVELNPAFRGTTGFYQAIPINVAKELLQNPQYERLIPLETAFPPNFELIMKGKTKQIDAINGRAPGARGGKAGWAELTLRTNSLVDLLLLIKSPGRDLAIAAFNSQGVLIGSGDLKVPDYDGLFLDSEYPQEITVAVYNRDEMPADFGLIIYQINW